MMGKRIWIRQAEAEATEEDRVHRERWASNVNVWRHGCNDCKPKGGLATELCEKHSGEARRRRPCVECGTSILFATPEDRIQEGGRLVLCAGCEEEKPQILINYVKAQILCKAGTDQLKAQVEHLQQSLREARTRRSLELKLHAATILAALEHAQATANIEEIDSALTAAGLIAAHCTVTGLV